MAENDVGLITTPEMAMILVGAAIAHAMVTDQVRNFNLNTDGGSYLTLYANRLDLLGKATPNTRTEQVFALASRLLMQTEFPV